ncbi:MAG: DegV family protein [Oscillospiraceae bacterium]|nr:DegV family protein [Oscillospiraceae bacterium]
MKIRITSDSTCDLSKQQIEENNIRIIPLVVSKDGQSYYDCVTIQPAEIFAHVAKGGGLCSTSAVSVGDYQDIFTEELKNYDAVIHVSLGSGFSVTHHNAVLAAEDMPNVRVIDSRNLSTGHGHVVLQACKLAKTMEDLDAIEAELKAFAPRVDASFLLDRLDYMVKGGRCSMVAALGANLLKLKPCIEVVDNKMVVGKKYRGNYAKSMGNYVRARLEGATDLEDDLIFVTHTPVSQEILDTVHGAVKEYGNFKNVVDTTAGCTVSCHCGEGCLGILYVHKA